MSVYHWFTPTLLFCLCSLFVSLCGNQLTSSSLLTGRPFCLTFSSLFSDDWPLLLLSSYVGLPPLPVADSLLFHCPLIDLCVVSWLTCIWGHTLTHMHTHAHPWQTHTRTHTHTYTRVRFQSELSLYIMSHTHTHVLHIRTIMLEKKERKKELYAIQKIEIDKKRSWFYIMSIFVELLKKFQAIIMCEGCIPMLVVWLVGFTAC